MMDWTVLGIAPTKDKKAITAAYRTRLPHVHPEDKPEEFKALRAAYEQALKLADQADVTPERDESPVGLWMERVRQIYFDFQARQDVAAWQELLTRQVCLALDTRPLAEDALLQFLLEDYFLPQKVWQVLDGAFHWMERREELYEHYPRNFVDYAMLNGIRYPDNLPYELFSPGLDAQACDQYRRIYFGGNPGDPEALAQLVQNLQALPERHPYGELLVYQLMLRENPQEARSGYEQLADIYPADARLQFEWAAQCMGTGDFATAEQYARRSLETRPDSYAVKALLCDSLTQQGQYEDAKKVLFELMDAAGGDPKQGAQLQEKLRGINEALVATWQTQLEANPRDDDARSKLAWCYLQNDRSQEALDLSEQFAPDYPDRYDFHNLKAGALYDLGRHEEALPHFEAMLALLRTMEPDGTDKTARRLEGLPQKLQLFGSSLMSLNRMEEAMAALEEALALAPQDATVLTNMGRVLLSQKRQEEALPLFERLVNVLPGGYHGFYLLAHTLFDLGRDRDAFDAINRALELDGSDLAVYLLKMRILLRNGVWDEVRSTIDFLHEHGITDEINTCWCEAQLLEYADEKKDEALTRYRAIAERIEAGEPMEEPARVYFRILVLEGDKLDARKAEDRQTMLALADKGLAQDADDPACLDYKAWLLRKDKRYDEALELYRRLAAIPRQAQRAQRDIAATYYDDLDRYAKEALEAYERFLQQEEEPADHFFAGTCCRYLHRFAEGEAHFLRLQELDPGDIDGYNGLSYLYEWMGRTEDALAQIDKVIAMAEPREGDQSRYYRHKVRLLRRLGRPMEAIDTINLSAEKYGNLYASQEKFEVCCQFGLWNTAKEVLRHWKKLGRTKSLLAAAEIDYALYTGNFTGAKALLALKKRSLEEHDAERLTLLLAELDGDEAAQMKIWNKRLADGDNQTHELMNMAQVQWWGGHYDTAREYAARTLDQLEQIIPTNRGYEALYRSRKALVLAMLDRMEEARTELAAVRQLPLCEDCDYSSCKDADIFEANFEEIAGNWQRAWALHKAGSEKWPDDLDFVAGMRRMERKGAGKK